jgi:aspartate aminotransferase-like enzyme
VIAEYVDVEWGRAVSPAAVRAAFDRVPEAVALLVQASETSTGVYHPIRELAAVVKENPQRMIVVDGISAIGVHDIPMDAWNLDVVVSGSQKSWLLPPGLAFVAVSPRAREAIQASRHARFYFDLRAELKNQADNQTAYTPAVSLISGLREALTMILEEGLPKVFARHELLANTVRASMRAIGLKLLAPDAPSYACTAVYVPDGVDGKAFVKLLRDRYNITIAAGQGSLTTKIFRIGHMGAVDEFDMLTAVAAVEMALADLGYPVKMGEGTRVAQEALRDALGRKA